ncbi:uncharacterized protein YndB with AHSA1/START domain [Caldalkalibacillus uzonensis]|uniref:Uncharacterized protein YndB with AHSA1/START domain n=1 Tax=Caldalkalibacillus uzonensis TaxID=353224 RepID=A0ABU0CTM0_9BACI|nr:SRPBCC domain-containing protein [Caldalkalibacillus uzonensis]MDQ0339689.1 uncharacterized protein YndB with AHSA1/START domain [Caldalkalibacillus uzonensis]
MKDQTQNSLPDICKTTAFNAPIDKVWQTVSTSEGIAAWFMPNDFVAEVGQTFTLQTPFGPTPCKVLELEPPHLLSFAWGESGWQVTFELQALGDKTQFTLTHSGWGAADEVIPTTGEKQSVVRDRMDNGWEGIVNNNLAKVVEG